MTNLVDTIRGVVTAQRGGGKPVCMVCGRHVSPSDGELRLRGGTIVHRACATYDMRRRRTGAGRLGYPRR